MKVLDADIIATAADAKGFPQDGLPEIAFLGRSNSGKSSLLNRLAQRRNLARTSSTPGKTRLVHFFRLRLREHAVTPSGRDTGAVAAAPDTKTGVALDVDRELLLVDLPGYGFAQVSKAEQAKWHVLVEGYLDGRAPLRVAVLLMDLRRDPRDDEHDLLAWLVQRCVPVVVALTKADKLAPMQRARRVRELARSLDVPAGQIVTTSSQTGLGIDALWSALLVRL
jgi:GTP-binding protein